MAEYEVTLSKRTSKSGQNHLIFPKTKSSLVKHGNGSTVETDLNAATTNITKLKNAVLATQSSDMVDTTKLYVLDGHFYEYNSSTSQWVQLGVAGASTIEVTSTLTSASAGKAADAAAVDARFTPLETIVDSLVMDFETNEFLAFIVRDEESNVILQIDQSGNAQFIGDIGAAGAIFSDNVTVKSLTVATGNNSPVAGITNAGAISGASLSVTGAVSAASVTATGAATVGSTLNVTGATTLSSTLTVTGAVTGSSSITGASLNIKNGDTTTASITTAGAISGASIYVTGAGSIGGTLTVSGSIASPTITALQNKTDRFSTSESGFSWAILDANSNVTFGVDSSGNITTAGTLSSTNITTMTNKLQRVAAPSGSYVFRVTNTSGTVIFGITNDGQVKSTGAMTGSTTL